MNNGRYVLKTTDAMRKQSSIQSVATNLIYIQILITLIF